MGDNTEMKANVVYKARLSEQMERYEDMAKVLLVSIRNSCLLLTFNTAVELFHTSVKIFYLLANCFFFSFFPIFFSKFILV